MPAFDFHSYPPLSPNGILSRLVTVDGAGSLLDSDFLDGGDWATPGSLGTGTPNAASFTTIAGSGILTLSNYLKFGNSISSFVTSVSSPLLYSTSSSGAGIFAEAGNLVVSPRISGAARDVIVSIAGTASDFKFDRNGVLTVASATDASAIGTASVVLTGGLSVAKKIYFGGTLTAVINSGSTINLDLSDTAASRSAALFRVNTSATAHTSAGVMDIISGASSSSDMMVRLRANGVNTLICYADGSATAAGIWTLSNSTDASSTITGGAVVSGGLGVAKKLYVGTGVYINSGTLLHSITALTNGAGVGAGTLLNAPVAGNPTKWIPIDDNGTTRYVPAW